MNTITKLLAKRRERGVSPVISTIIIVAVAIAISIAVALYLVGITGTFTRFERLDITSAYANSLDNGNSTIDMRIANTGTSALTIDGININGKPEELWVTYNNTEPILIDGSGKALNTITLQQGDRTDVHLGILARSGQSVEVVLHTVSGKEYPKIVVVP